jgi:hypothetical protein
MEKLMNEKQKSGSACLATYGLELSSLTIKETRIAFFATRC